MSHKSEDYERLPMLEDDANDGNASGPSESRSAESRQNRRKFWAYHFFFLSAYAIISFALAREWRLHSDHKGDQYGVLGSYSPAQSAIKYKSYVFNAAPNLTSPYVGESRPSLDKAWHDLLRNTNMRITDDDLAKVNRDSIPLGKGGGYYGEMAVFHELHCLKFLRQAFHMDYYGHSFGEKERKTMPEHTEHCIELLRQGVMCRGDPTLITFHWGHTVKLPQPDFTLQHKCVNWDHLMAWTSERAINVFEEGMLVHPTLGPAYPGGFREDRPRPTENEQER